MSSVSKAAKARLKESFQVDPHSPKADGVKKVCFDLGDASVEEFPARPFAFSVTARDSRRVVLAARDDSEFSTLWNLVSARPAGEARREPGEHGHRDPGVRRRDPRQELGKAH